MRYPTFWWYLYARTRSNDVRDVPASHGRHLQTVAQRILDDQRARADESNGLGTLVCAWVELGRALDALAPAAGRRFPRGGRSACPSAAGAARARDEVWWASCAAGPHAESERSQRARPMARGQRRAMASLDDLDILYWCSEGVRRIRLATWASSACVGVFAVSGSGAGRLRGYSSTCVSWPCARRSACSRGPRGGREPARAAPTVFRARVRGPRLIA